MKKVLIMLSTYNGNRYLREQLDSLYSQEGVDIHILVRDDESKDNTMSILEQYFVERGNMSIIKGSNIGAGPSFLSLVNDAATKFTEYDYYAFSDQDDVWFKNKIISGVDALENRNNKYKLYISNSTITDAELHPISPSGIKFVNSFGANLVANHILGCTMLLNKSLLLEVNKINTVSYKISNGEIPIHDGWTAFVAYSLGADVVYNAESMMYYRQHGNNVIGSGGGLFRILLNRIKRYTGTVTHVKANRSIIALQVLGNEIPKKNKQLMELVANYKGNIKSKVRLLLDKRMYEYGFLDDVGTFFLILFNRF